MTVMPPGALASALHLRLVHMELDELWLKARHARTLANQNRPTQQAPGTLSPHSSLRASQLCAQSAHSTGGRGWW